MSEQKPQTAVEGYKAASDHLRGNLLEEITSPTPNVSDEAEQLLKFHGVYSQDNRDVRRERSQAGETLDYIFMIRVVVPGGHLTSEQWLALDEVADEVADGTLRLTTRQAVQFHGVLKHGLQPLARRVDQAFLTSFGGCGDVVRNIVMCPALQFDREGSSLTHVAQRLATNFRPTTSAHWEIFVNGERAASREAAPERDFYGAQYLPRKFKIAIAHPHDNCVDVYAQDVGLIPTRDPELGDGFTMMVAGGLGRNYANEATFTRLADPFTFVTYDEVDDVIAAVVATYKDLGDRTDRKRARMKYIVADLGLEFFRSEVEHRLGRSLRPAPSVSADFNANDHLGWHHNEDGTWRLGIRVSAGRVRDDDQTRLRSALRQLATALPLKFFLTPNQDVVLDRFEEGEKVFVEQLLREANVRFAEDLGPVERTAMACPALPTCSQALTEAERRLPDVVAAVEGSLASAGVGRRPLQLRLTGCPNGCARAAVAEVGIVGRTKSTYDLYLGGGSRGDRLAGLYVEKVKLDDVASTLEPLFVRWKNEGVEGETFGDFATRVVLR